MIYSISFPKSKKAYTYTERSGLRMRTKNSPFVYIADQPNLAGKTFRFKSGLNILIGPNGSGKSTILKACGLSLAAVQGGQSTVSEEWCREAFGFFGQDKIIFPWETQHNGRPAAFVDPRINLGLTAGGAAFDDSFFALGVSNLMFRGSTGEKTMAQISRAVGMILGKISPPTEIMRTSTLADNRVNDIWSRRMEVASEYLQGDGMPGPVTILMDEPESYLSIPMQVGFWKRFMSEDASRFDNLQVIVATHSPFALDVPFANYIELGKGYLLECREAMSLAAR